MRLFVAVEIPPEILDRLRLLIEDLREEVPGVRWARPEGIHLTLKFLGEVTEQEVGPLRLELAKAVPGSTSPFPVDVAGTGVFPEKGRPRVVWAGLRQDGEALPGERADSLVELRAAVEGAVRAAGLTRVKEETRPFKPHLTLARLGEGRPPAALAEAIASRREMPVGRFVVSSVWLFQSHLKPGGAVYRKMEEYRL